MKQGVKHTIKKNCSYYVTMTVVDWIDIFSRQNHRDVVISSLQYCIKNKGLNVYAFCLMTNHLHMIVNCNEPFQLHDVIRDFKRFCVKKIIEQIKEEPESRREWLLKAFSEAGENYSRNKYVKFWQTGNHAIELYNEAFVWRKMKYIHNNPVKAKLVRKPEDWIYSSASNYILGEGILEEVCRLDPMLQTFN